MNEDLPGTIKMPVEEVKKSRHIPGNYSYYPRETCYPEHHQFLHFPSSLPLSAPFVTKNEDDGQNVRSHLEGCISLPILPSVAKSSQFGNLH